MPVPLQLQRVSFPSNAFFLCLAGGVGHGPGDELVPSSCCDGDGMASWSNVCLLLCMAGEVGYGLGDKLMRFFSCDGDGVTS